MKENKNRSVSDVTETEGAYATPASAPYGYNTTNTNQTIIPSTTEWTNDDNDNSGEHNTETGAGGYYDSTTVPTPTPTPPTTTETPDDDDTPEGGYDVPSGGENGSSTTTTTDPVDGEATTPTPPGDSSSTTTTTEPEEGEAVTPTPPDDSSSTTTTTVYPNIPVTSVTLSHDNVTLEKDMAMKLYASVLPTNASNPFLAWSSSDPSIATVAEDGKVVAKSKGTAVIKVCALDGSGASACCTVTVVTNYCGGANYRDVTRHSMLLQDGYYVCSKCGYRIKSPALQDKDILSLEDYIKMIAVMHYYAHNVLLARERPLSAYFYNAEAENCKIVMDTIRSQSQYSYAYEYQGPNNKYLANETDDTITSFVSKSAIDAVTIGYYNGFYETIATLVIGYYCPPMGTLIDIISLANDIATGEMDAISFGAFIAGLVGLDDVAVALSFFSSASEIIDCDVIIGDPVVHISFSAYAYAEYVFDTNYNIKKVSINYTV